MPRSHREVRPEPGAVAQRPPVGHERSAAQRRIALACRSEQDDQQEILELNDKQTDDTVEKLTDVLERSRKL